MPKDLLFNYNVSNKCLSMTLFPIRSHCLFLLSLHLMHLILLYLSQVYSSVFLTFFTLMPLYLVNLQPCDAMLKLVDAEVKRVFQLLLHTLVAGGWPPSFFKSTCVLGVFLCLAVIHLTDKLPLSFIGFLCVLGHPVWLSGQRSWKGWCQRQLFGIFSTFAISLIHHHHIRQVLGLLASLGLTLHKKRGEKNLSF